jgi:hypothetical protein
MCDGFFFDSTTPQLAAAGDTFKTEAALELVDDLASLPTRQRKKKKTPRSDDLYAF